MFDMKAHRQHRYGVFQGFLRMLRSRPCLDCSQTFPWYVMEFDHIKPARYRQSHGGAAIACLAYAKWKVVVEELSKVEIVCSNCHSIRTHLRRGL
jgi:5-methylcytosine-specific restriction endonuclease McrA